MQRLSISEFSSYRWTFFQDVVNYSAAGIGSIGVWRSKLDEYGAEAAAELLHEMQMRVSSLSWAGGFTGSNGYSHSFSVEDAIQAVYQAHMIGADKLIVHPGALNSHTHSHAMRLVKSGIESMLPTARDLGVQLLVEPIFERKNPWSFMNSLESYLDLLWYFCPSQIGLVLDLFHVGRYPQILSSASRIADRIALVQLADCRNLEGHFVRCELGSGCVPINAWLNVLEEAEYDGDFEIELHGCQFENDHYTDLLERSQNYIAASIRGVGSSSVR